MKTVNLKIDFIGEQLTTGDLTEELRQDFLNELELNPFLEEYTSIELKTKLYGCHNLINIDKMLLMLIKLKENNATHVNVDFEGSYNRYQINGFEIYREPEENKVERLAREELKRKSKIQIKINKLNKQLEDLEKELHSK